MDSPAWCEWLKERLAIDRYTDTKRRVLFVDTFSSHLEDHQVDAGHRAINMTLVNFHLNAADLVQTADLFIIEKVNGRRRRLRDKLSMIL